MSWIRKKLYTKFKKQDSKENSLRELSILKDIQNGSWQCHLMFMGFDSQVAQHYMNLRTHVANIENLNLFERSFIEEGDVQASITTVCKKLDLIWEKRIFKKENLQMITVSMSTSTPAWISTLYGSNKYREDVNIQEYGEYEGIYTLVSIFDMVFSNSEPSMLN